VAVSSLFSPKEYDFANPGIDNISANIGINSVLLDLRNINIKSIITLAKNIIQKASPKNAVQTNVEGLISGHIEHRKDDNNATIPQIPIVAFPKPCKNVFLLSFFSAITSCFV
jgi:hypothetical protein